MTAAAEWVSVVRRREVGPSATRTKRLVRLRVVPRYQPGFKENDYERLKVAIRSVADVRRGPFTANQAAFQIAATGVTDNAGDVVAILMDLTDAGYLRQLPTDPPSWDLDKWQW